MAFEEKESFADKLKSADWRKIGLYHALPITLSLVIGGVVFGGSKAPQKQAYSEEKILSDVELPSQISKLQNSQLTVLESQLKKLGEDINLNDEQGVYSKEDKASLTLATLNYDTNLTNFFKTLLSFDSETNAESQYSSLSNFLENPLTSKTSGINNQDAVAEKESMLAFLKSQSWAKETRSKVSLAGNVIPALLTGSTAENKLYLVTVPATNDKREFKNLNYIVSLGKTNKVRRIVYQGEVENNADLETWYKGLEAVVTNNVGEFLYLQQPSYEERQAEENRAFLEKIKTAFKLEKDGERKTVRLDGENVIVGQANTLEGILKDEYNLTDEQIKTIMQSITSSRNSNKATEQSKEEVKTDEKKE